MAQIDLKMSKHNEYACYASSASLAAAHKKVMEQAWASIEAQCVDRVCIELCKPHGRIANLDEFYGVCYNTVINKPLKVG